MRKLLLICGLSIFIVSITYLSLLRLGFIRLQTITGKVIEPKPGQSLTIHTDSSISWQLNTNKTIPFTIIYLQDSDKNTLGPLGTIKENTFTLTWNTSFYLQGDIGRQLETGEYHIKIIGYNNQFCYTGECAPGSKQSASQVFELQSELFKIE